MATNRMFVSQETLDRWLSEERVDVDGDVMTLKPEGSRFSLVTAVHFKSELTGEGDPHRLVGKVKDIGQLTAMGGEHCADSVILGDYAYEVVEGFLGIALDQEHAVVSGHNLAAATRAALGDGPPSGEIDLLARFFLGAGGR